MKYRVIIKVGYCEAYFDFDTPLEAADFATIALSHHSESEDTKKKKISMEIINTEIEEEDESD